MKQLTQVLLFCFIANMLWAAETASVLPSNIMRARLVSVFTEQIIDSYDKSGKQKGLSHSLNQNLDMKAYAKMNPDLGKLAQALNALEPGLGNNLLNTQLYSETTMSVRQNLAALEYGASEKLTFGIRVPIVNTKITSDFEAVTTNNANAISRKMGKNLSRDVDLGLQKLASQKMNTAFFKSEIFTNKGYKAPSTREETELGDVEMGAKYQFYKSPVRTMAFQVGIRVPTGSTKAIDEVFYQGTGKGAWGLGTLVFHDYQINKNWKMGAMAKTVYNFPDTKKRAVPKDENDSLPSLLEEDDQVKDVERKQALDFESELSATYTFNNPAWETWGALQYSMSGKDQFYGEGDLYYEGLSQDTDFASTDLEVGFLYSSIPAFRKKQAAFPWKIETLYKRSLAGYNTTKVSYVRMDMIVFF